MKAHSQSFKDDAKGFISLNRLRRNQMSEKILLFSVSLFSSKDLLTVDFEDKIPLNFLISEQVSYRIRHYSRCNLF